MKKVCTWSEQKLGSEITTRQSSLLIFTDINIIIIYLFIY